MSNNLFSIRPQKKRQYWTQQPWHKTGWHTKTAYTNDWKPTKRTTKIQICTSQNARMIVRTNQTNGNGRETQEHTRLWKLSEECRNSRPEDKKHASQTISRDLEVRERWHGIRELRTNTNPFHTTTKAMKANIRPARGDHKKVENTWARNKWATQAQSILIKDERDQPITGQPESHNTIHLTMQHQPTSHGRIKESDQTHEKKQKRQLHMKYLQKRLEK